MATKFLRPALNARRIKRLRQQTAAEVARQKQRASDPNRVPFIVSREVARALR